MNITTLYQSIFIAFIPTTLFITQQSYAGSDEYCSPDFSLD